MSHSMLFVHDVKSITASPEKFTKANGAFNDFVRVDVVAKDVNGNTMTIKLFLSETEWEVYTINPLKVIE